MLEEMQKHLPSTMDDPAIEGDNDDRVSASASRSTTCLWSDEDLSRHENYSVRSTLLLILYMQMKDTR